MAILKTLATSAALVLATGAAQAHVAAYPPEAPAGGYQVVYFRVGHGCADVAATTALRIELPPEVLSARPQPKSGWTLSVDHTADAPTTAAAVTWTGQLPADQFDEFAIMLRLPPGAQTLYFPTVQTCGEQDAQWTEIPDPGENARALASPAPSLRLVPAAGAGETHQH